MTIEQAIDSVKKGCKAKFDSTVELHINTNLDVSKPEQTIRVSVVLPKGTGKKVRVGVFASKNVETAAANLSESDIAKISKGELDPKKEFDVIIAEPRFMPKLAAAARVLGPAGLMPSPKSGTVTEDVEKAVEQVKKGKIEIRTEPNAPLIHTVIGKRSFSTADLAANFGEVMAAINQAKPSKAKPDWIKSVYISTTMSPSALVDIPDLA
ncbi:MAG: 50S ribosomal protein L1 [candidate division WWE3 bacterium GW2011_GWA1_46_21]|uniref:Large ribosomal subunit protein uL1 n=2 Tax=Katanobacteria TaxID=422282 RepID=A0A0G1RK25_UNCKA|nr:MAG: 50S ribosomal protein L1 [candidate division WWE3 bacterium GW2011_GWA1_46_21]KKU56573.1 MAG: 50S ribosomal protein L1 [candidate division WWE3 bacterium GW2011_GWB1_47_11]